MNYKPKTILDTQIILDLLVEDSELSNEKLRDISGLSLDVVRHAIQRLKKHGCIKSDKQLKGYMFGRNMVVLKTNFVEVLEHE